MTNGAIEQGIPTKEFNVIIEQYKELFAEKAAFLTKITGLPAVSAHFAREYKPKSRHASPDLFNIGYETSLALSDGKNIYKITSVVKFADEYAPDEPMPVSTWSVKFNDLSLNQPRSWANASFNTEEFYDLSKRMKYLWSEFSHALGGPTTEVPFMDFERYTLESLKDKDDYFDNIYLTLMTHMKDRGLIMPPIFSKRDDVRNLMTKGKVFQLEDRLKVIVGLEGGFLDERCRAHMEYEALEILKQAQWEKNKKDPTVPLKETFPHNRIIPVEGTTKTFGKYNILAVENNDDDPISFPDIVVAALKRDGRWKGGNVISAYSLSNCMGLCGTGKIDVVLFDWRNPSHEEVMMVRHEATNPIFTAFHGDVQGVLDPVNGRVILSDGRTLTDDELKKESERIDIRHLWQNKIAGYCRKMEVAEPAFYIVRNLKDEKNLAAIVAGMIGKR